MLEFMHLAHGIEIQFVRTLIITHNAQVDEWKKELATNICTNTHSPFIYYDENRPHELSLFIKYKTQIHIFFLCHSQPQSQMPFSMTNARLSLIFINNKQLSNVYRICCPPNRKTASKFGILPIRHVRRKVQCDLQTMRWNFFPYNNEYSPFWWYRNCCCCSRHNKNNQIHTKWKCNGNGNRVNNQINSQVNCVCTIFHRSFGTKSTIDTLCTFVENSAINNVRSNV